MQTLKFLSIFVKYSCFFPVKHEKSIKVFRVQVRQKNQIFRVKADVITKFAFRLNCFLFVDMSLGNVRNESFRVLIFYANSWLIFRTF